MAKGIRAGPTVVRMAVVADTLAGHMEARMVVRMAAMVAIPGRRATTAARAVVIAVAQAAVSTGARDHTPVRVAIVRVLTEGDIAKKG